MYSFSSGTKFSEAAEALVVWFDAAQSRWEKSQRDDADDVDDDAEEEGDATASDVSAHAHAHARTYTHIH